MARNAVPINRGIIEIKSIFGRYLQGHKDNGEMHASNGSRGDEETWYLYEVDPVAKIYGLRLWANNAFLKVIGGNPYGVVRADEGALDGAAEWTFLPGAPFGVPNAVAMVSAIQSYLFANAPGQDDHWGGGEVFARLPAASFPGGANPPVNTPSWPGWWYLAESGPPPEGRGILGDVVGALETVAEVIPIVLGVVGGGGEGQNQPAPE